MILRQALKKDVISVKKVLKPWTDLDPAVTEVLDSLVEDPATRFDGCCRVFESDKTVDCVSLWLREGPAQIRLLAFAARPAAGYSGVDARFLREEIMDWADMGIAKVVISVPESLGSPVLGTLRACGFMFEGLISSFAPEKRPHAQLCKHLLRANVSHPDLLTFLRDFLLSQGCEIRSEGEGFGYRVRSEYRFPFIFSPWHRVIRSGGDIVVHPPARVIELHELETLFYPLSIRARNEKPLLVHIEKKIAAQMIDVPRGDSFQSSLFRGTELNLFRTVKLNELAYTAPVGLSGLRKGLPLLFYVNRLGAVGTARVENWYLDAPEDLFDQLDEMAQFDLDDVKEHAARSGPKTGKVLAIRFQWYRPLSRVVPLEEIREMDDSFNPQRTLTLAPRLFQSIVAAGAGPDT